MKQCQQNRRRINKTIRMAARSRGSIAEERVESLVSEMDGEWPIWVFSGRRATRDEDRSGKDFIFTTDVGKLFIQIKSSIAGVNKFNRQARPRRMIEPVIITADVDRDEMRTRILAALYTLRHQVFERRGR